MADDTPSAAERVFGVAELAEHILCYLARAGIEAKGRSPNHDALQPLACLSAIQRMSCAFRDTITTSKKIQRLLQITMKNGTEARMRWLLQDFLGLYLSMRVRWNSYLSEHIAEEAVLEINTQQGCLRTKFVRFSSGYKSASEAGWRKMEITDSDNVPRIIKVKALHVQLSIQLRTAAIKSCHFLPNELLPLIPVQLVSTAKVHSV